MLRHTGCNSPSKIQASSTFHAGHLLKLRLRNCPQIPCCMAIPKVSAVRFSLLDAIPNVAYIVTDSGRCGDSPFGDLHLSRREGTSETLRHREFVAQTLNISLSRCVFMQQQHTSNVAAVDGQAAGRGAFDRSDALPSTDGITTATPSLALFALAADCQSILLYAPDVPAVAAVHCGWRGTLQNIPRAAVEAMRRTYGASPHRLIGCLAPCIGPLAFEVRDDVASLFRTAHPSIPLHAHPDPTKHYIDLPGANRALLIAAGLLPEHIECHPQCTYGTWPRFFSARRGDSGRFAAGITLMG